MNIVDTTVNGRAYRLVKLPPLQAGRLALRVTKILAGAASELGLVQTLTDVLKGNLDELKQGDASIDKTALGLKILESSPALVSALAGGVSKIDADELYNVAIECVRGQLFASTKLSTEDALNAHFGEYPQDMLPVMAWALRMNCAGFFGLRVLALS